MSIKIVLFACILLVSMVGCKKKVDFEAEQRKATTKPVETQAEPEEKFVTVKITATHGVFTTSREVNFGEGTTSLELDNGKRVWIGQGFVAEEQ